MTDLTEMATPTPRDVYDHEKKLGKLGNCYENAVTHVLFKDKKAKLVHGRPTHQVGGYEFGHAWTEKGEMVYDPETGFRGPRDIYYMLGHINPDDCKVYGAELARKWLLYTGYYGPFEGVDAMKPTNEYGMKKPRTGRKAKHTSFSKQEQEWKKAMDAMRDSKGKIDPQKEFAKATEMPPVKVGLGKGRPATAKPKKKRPWAEYDRRATGFPARPQEDLGEARSAFSEAVKEAIRENKAVYLAAVGGAGALIAKSITKSEVVAYEELGPEAVLRLEVEDFPAIVIDDCHGGDLYQLGKAEYKVPAEASHP